MFVFIPGRRVYLDEDLSVEGLLAGIKSGESAKSFAMWLEAKRSGLPVNIHEIRCDEHDG